MIFSKGVPWSDKGCSREWSGREKVQKRNPAMRLVSEEM